MSAEAPTQVPPRPVFAGYGHEISDRDRAAWQRWIDGRAQDSFRRGQAAASAGDGPTALFWLDRAARMARDNTHVALALGMAQLSAGRWAEALATMDRLSASCVLREALFGQAVACLRLGDPMGASHILGRALSRFAPAPAVHAMAAQVAEAAGAAGWCGVEGGGRVLGLSTGAVTWRLRRSASAGGTTRWASGFPGDLPASWRDADWLDVLADGRPLLGSPADLRAIRRSEGVVQPAEGGVEGWLWHPADPDHVPVLQIEGEQGAAMHLTLTVPATDVDTDVPLARPRRFFVPTDQLPEGTLRFLDGYGAGISGSPIDRGLIRLFDAPVRRAPERPRRRSGTQPIPAVRPRAAGWLVIVPAYRDLPKLRACLQSVFDTMPDGVEIMVVDDATPEPALARYLDRLAASGRITLRRQDRNAGFPSAANIGLRAAAGRDVVLLNSDTIVPRGWLEGLRHVLDAEPTIGTATPFSNDASILSYPSVKVANPPPDRRETQRLADLCARLPLRLDIDLPTANGFCMAIRGDCLAQTGLLREDAFAQGYGEENDFCCRATALGWRHVAATNVFVAHVGGVSFGAARRALMRRNLRILNRLHPGYDAAVQAFVRRDPLFEARRALDGARLRQACGRKRSIAMLLHDSGGGVARVVRERAAAFEHGGLFVLTIRPDTTGCRLICAAVETDSLVFRLPAEWPQLLGLLRDLRVQSLEWHHLIGHAPMMRGLHQALAVPYDIFIHDYVWFCQRVSLLGPRERYCGEPSPEGCAVCIAEVGSYLGETISMPDFLARSDRELRGARRLMAPSGDTARRIARHFPDLTVDVLPLEDDAAWPDIRMMTRGFARRRIGFVGGIGAEKGYDVIRALAEDAQMRDLALDFVVVGHTPDDEALFETGRVLVTGEYRESEVMSIIRDLHIEIGFIPSITPETWCFALGVIWQAGLPCVSFDLGAQAERIRRTGRGWTVPLGMPASALNNFLLRL